jgi:membrane fusion protein (multidrug efflux system)
MKKRHVASAVAVVAIALVAYVLAFGWPWAARNLPADHRATRPPPEVGVVTVVAAEVPLPIEYAGRVVGVRDVEVRALVGGLLMKRDFEEGDKVKEGQLLFQIDPAPYRVAVSRAEAQLAQAQAALRQAEENYVRVDELTRRNVATEKQREDARATRDQARAAVQGAQAEIANANLNLGYTEIHAPVGGLAALNSPSIGSLIQAQQTLLTTITPQDPAYVSFSFTDEEGQAYRDLNERRAKPIDDKDLSVELYFGNGRLYAHRGKLDTSAPRVDPQTGTIQARAVFPNPTGLLLPGQFIRLRILGITLLDAIAIRKEAVSQGPQGPFVYIIGPNDVAEVRPVRLGQQVGLDWVISDGLKPTERVVVDGVIRVRAGEKVTPVKYVRPVESHEQAPGAPLGARP